MEHEQAALIQQFGVLGELAIAPKNRDTDLGQVTRNGAQKLGELAPGVRVLGARIEGLEPVLEGLELLFSGFGGKVHVRGTGSGT